MKKAISSIILFCLFSCSKSSENTDDMRRDLTVNVMAVNATINNVSSNNWEVHLQTNKSITEMSGNIIVQHDLWDLGQYKATYIDTFNYKFENENSFSFRSKRNANMQGPEIKNIKVNKFTQSSGNYTVTIK